MHEDLPDDRRIVQGADQAQPAPSVRTRQDVNGKHPVHEGRPASGHGDCSSPWAPGLRASGGAKPVGSGSTVRRRPRARQRGTRGRSIDASGLGRTPESMLTSTAGHPDSFRITTTFTTKVSAEQLGLSRKYLILW